MHATLNDVVHDQRTAVGGALNDVVHDQRTAVGGAVPKDINGSVFFFREEIEFVETEIRVFAD